MVRHAAFRGVLVLYEYPFCLGCSQCSCGLQPDRDADVRETGGGVTQQRCLPITKLDAWSVHMQIAEAEIVEGLVAYLDQSVLSANEQVLDTCPQASTQVRPFVCVRAANGRSQWAPLSTSWRRERLAIAAA